MNMREQIELLLCAEHDIDPFDTGDLFGTKLRIAARDRDKRIGVLSENSANDLAALALGICRNRTRIQKIHVRSRNIGADFPIAHTELLDDRRGLRAIELASKRGCCDTHRRLKTLPVTKSSHPICGHQTAALTVVFFMTPKEHHIKTNRTARLYTLGSFEGKGKHLWIVAHGYSTLAKDFIELFSPIVDDRTIIVAPEGLSRYYTKGLAGEIGASWMTKEDREFEIYDYVEYLDRVAEGIIERLEAPPARITAFGFSQGCPTITRWTALGSVKPDEVVLWCGDTPTDLDFDAYSEKMESKTTWFGIGANDSIISKEIYNRSIALLKDRGLRTQEFRFDGGHAIPSEHLKTFKESLIGKS